MAPTLAQAKRRKWWIACTAVLENLMFAAVLLGWSSLLLMLKKEGFYSNLCVKEEHVNVTYENGSFTNVTELPERTTAEFSTKNDEAETHSYPTCVEQDEILNRYFSIGSSLLSGVTLILGVIMDKYGSRLMRLCGCWTFMLSCACFAVGSLDTDRLSFLMAPAVCLNGMGGIVYVFTSFPIPNLFENIRSTMISLMIGSYSASAVLYMLFKVAYDAGVPFVWLMTFHAMIGFLTFINAYFNIPQEPLPGPDDITYAIKFNYGELRFDHKISGKQFLSHANSVGRRMSNVDTAPTESLMDMSGEKEEQQAGSFFKVLLTPCVLWSFVMMCVVQLRLIAYMGSLEMYLKASAKLNDLDPTESSEIIETYTLIFGILQINCFLMAPVIGTIMDWKLKKYSGQDDVYKGRTRKGQLIRNLMTAFTVTNLLLLIFGIIVLFEKHIQLQVVAFILHTAIRTFLHSSMGALYACMYHFSHFGKLTGLSSFLSALFILVQDPLFVVVNSSLGGDPFWINVGLLVVAISGFGLPLYLWRYLRGYERDLRSDRIDYGDLNGSHHLSTINEDDECQNGSVKYINGSKLSNGITKGLADEQEVHLSINAITF